MSTIFHEFRYSFRSLARNPNSTLTTVVTLGLGIGAVMTVFTLVNAIVLRPLPYRNADRLVLLTTYDSKSGEFVPVSRVEFVGWREHCQGLEELAAFTILRAPFEGAGQSGYGLEVAASAGFFHLLGVSPFMGRTFLPGEDSTGAGPVAVLSYGMWQRVFGGDLSVIGKNLTLSNVSYSIVGIMPPRFKSPMYSGVDVWLPLRLDSGKRNDPLMDYLTVLGRQKHGLSLEQAQSQMEATVRAGGPGGPGHPAGLHLELITLHEVIVGGFRHPLLTLFGGVWFVLLIACANQANMLLARVTARRKDVAIHIALGAGRGQVMRRLLTESLLLGLGGYFAAVPLAYWAVKALVALLPPYAPRLDEVAIDLRVLAFALPVSVLAGLASGSVPALQASALRTGGALSDTLKEGGAGMASGFRRNWIGRLIVVPEIACALMLSVGAGLMVRTFFNLRPTDTGFDPEGKLVAYVKLPKAKYATEGARAELFDTIRQRLRAVPAISDAAAALPVPMSGGWAGHVTVLGRPPEPDEQSRVTLRAISDNYFKVMRIHLVAGRSFSPLDNQGSPPAAIVNQAAAQRFWPGEDFLGKHLMLPEVDPKKTWQVVGVTVDERMYGSDTKPHPQVYVPYLQHPMPNFDLVVQAFGDPAKLGAVVRGQVSSVDKAIDVVRIETMEQTLSDSVLIPRQYAVLAGGLAVLALILAAAGVYGLMSYSVTQRTHEMGIRMALGAERNDVLKLVVGEALGLAALGVTLGVFGALELTRSLSTLLYGVAPTDPRTFAGASLLLAATALVAGYVPARRATKVDPVIALRYE